MCKLSCRALLLFLPYGDDLNSRNSWACEPLEKEDMGVACSCCLPREDFDHEERGTGCCCQRCCRCCFFCCGGMWAALFHPSEEHDTGSPARNASPSQSAGLLGGSSSESSMPVVYGTQPDRRYIQPVGDASRPQKFAADFSRIINFESLQRRNGGNGGERSLVMQRVKGSNKSEEKKSTDEVSKFQQSITTGKVDSLTSSMDDEDICPTCLEGYDQENPKINTKCGHHFHLACILEWMERSSQCPVCDQDMVFNETP